MSKQHWQDLLATVDMPLRQTCQTTEIFHEYAIGQATVSEKEVTDFAAIFLLSIL